MITCLWSSLRRSPDSIEIEIEIGGMYTALIFGLPTYRTITIHREVDSADGLAHLRNVSNTLLVSVISCGRQAISPNHDTL